MVFINGQWEDIENLDDVSRIIRESFNTDLADAMDKLLAEAEQKNNNLENDLDELDGEIYDLQDTIEEQETDIEILQDTLAAVFKELQDKNLFTGTLCSLEAKAKRKGITIAGK